MTGSEIPFCNMTCRPNDLSMELHRVCREEEKLLENHIHYNITKSNDSRLHLDTQNGCWSMKGAEKSDSSVYNVPCSNVSGDRLSSTVIRVLDPVLISTMTSNGSRLGEDMAVSVQFSGEESAVTWELDGDPLPDRYRLIDDNRTLIIPGVQRDDAQRRFRVRITNPVSADSREYNVTNDPIFSKQLETEDSELSRRWGIIGGVIVMAAVGAYIMYRRCFSNAIQEPRTVIAAEYGPIPTVPQDGAVIEMLTMDPAASDPSNEGDGGDPVVCAG